MLDTNVAIHLRDRDPAVMAKVAALDDVAVLSIITRVELEAGVVANPDLSDVRRARLNAMYLTLETPAFDGACAEAYRQVLETTGFSRRKIIDRMIAAHALALGATLVTLNPADFRDVPGLRLQAL